MSRAYSEALRARGLERLRAEWVSIADIKCERKGGRNRLHPLFLSASVRYREGCQKKEAAPKSGLSLGRKRPRRAYGDKSPRFVIYGAPHKKAMGKSPKAQQKRVHVHYPRECDIFASKPSPSAPLGGCAGHSRSPPRMRLASFPTRFVPTPGLLNGQTARQIAQLSASLKYGRHLSKSTYQRRSLRTSVFSWPIASGGQASEQTRQFTQKSAAPKSSRPSASSGALVSTQASRKSSQNRGELSSRACPALRGPPRSRQGLIRMSRPSALHRETRPAPAVSAN